VTAPAFADLLAASRDKLPEPSFSRSLPAPPGSRGLVHEYEAIPGRPAAKSISTREKFEIRHGDFDQPDSLRDSIARINRIRKQSPALHSDWSLRFHPVDSDSLLCYSKQTPDLDNVIVVVINVEPYHTHSGGVDLPVESFGLDAQQPYQVHDLVIDARYLWQGRRNYVELNPQSVPAHILRIRRRVRTGKNFDYYNLSAGPRGSRWARARSTQDLPAEKQ
jgi:starch synthase (maltosyl-transferring)